MLTWIYTKLKPRREPRNKFLHAVPWFCNHIFIHLLSKLIDPWHFCFSITLVMVGGTIFLIIHVLTLDSHYRTYNVYSTDRVRLIARISMARILKYSISHYVLLRVLKRISKDAWTPKSLKWNKIDLHQFFSLQFYILRYYNKT